ncbi:hypothetical protein NYE27_21150 [Paenibacillus sp. FSL R10-2779]|uniref:hypothetical protein n=1 Tax=Paenibacillus sp. FSL R10-2779 TaxID=2975340 RepID=UPI0030F75025
MGVLVEIKKELKRLKKEREKNILNEGLYSTRLELIAKAMELVRTSIAIDLKTDADLTTNEGETKDTWTFHIDGHEINVTAEEVMSRWLVEDADDNDDDDEKMPEPAVTIGRLIAEKLQRISL